MNFVSEMKKVMLLEPSQKFVKGISSYDILMFLQSVRRDYKVLGKELGFLWKKVGRNHTAKRRGFYGKSIENSLLPKEGRYVLFGKAKWNSAAHKQFIKMLKKQVTEKQRFMVYGKKANGSKRADHAVGLWVGKEGKNFLYDNAMTNGEQEFSVQNVADKMADISQCYVLDIWEVL
jgi:hypothetical protein